LDKIVPQTTPVILVDSSDIPFKSFPNLNRINLNYIHTDKRSAAIQRNIGLDNVSIETKYVFFLDDDTIPDMQYFNSLCKLLSNEKVVGVSGLAINPNSKVLREKPAGFRGLIYKMFLLDSNRDGALLKSAVNIPCRNYGGEVKEVEWLIGCSGWNFARIQNTRFESDFMGASLAEDVIFSFRMSKKGKLLVDPKINLDHLEFAGGRPNLSDFWKMWMVNRYRLIQVSNWGLVGIVGFWWASLGQLLINAFSDLKSGEINFPTAKGILLGVIQIGFLKNEN
jgi:GT2 family glycosyltransferase